MTRRRSHLRKSRGSVDTLHLPLTYDFTQTGASVTTISTLASTIDRRRAFRIAGIRGEIACYKYPVLIQFQVFGSVNNADNVWSTQIMTIPEGSLRRFTHRIPVTSTGWYPSDAALTTSVCQLVNLCTSKATQGGLKGTVILTLELQPFEGDPSCPSLQAVQYGDHDQDGGPSSNSWEVLATST